MRTSSMKVTPLQPTATTTGEESNRYENLIIIMYMYSCMSLYTCTLYNTVTVCPTAVLNDGYTVLTVYHYTDTCVGQ